MRTIAAPGRPIGSRADEFFGPFLGAHNLNLGSARKILPGFVNLDLSPNVGADVVHDLEVLPLPFGPASFDAVFGSHVFEHIRRERFIPLVGDLVRILKPGGFLIITTGNKFVIDRLGDVGWHVYPSEHIEHELSRGQLRKLLTPHFDVLGDFTIIPHGTRGILRLVNSYRLNAIVGKLISREKLDALKEKAGFGWQMVFLGRKRV